MSRLEHGRVSTHDFARGLLAKRDEFIRMWGTGRFWIVWDTNVSVPPRVTFEEIRNPGAAIPEGQADA